MELFQLVHLFFRLPFQHYLIPARSFGKVILFHVWVICQDNRYKRLRMQAQKDMRSAHKKYMEEIVSNDLKENPKVFWSYIKSKRQESTGVAPLKNKDGFIHSDSSSKVEILNDQFVSAYTREDKSNIPKKGTSDHPTMDSIRVHRNGVLNEDEFPAFILKSAASQLHLYHQF